MCVILLALLANGHGGTAYGTPFPVMLRASFGPRGALVAALLRGLVGVGWFGIQAWIGASSIYQAIDSLWPGIGASPGLGGFLVINLGQLICFLLFIGLHVVFIMAGIQTLRWVQLVAPLVLIAGGAALIIWCWVVVGMQTMLDATYTFPDYVPHGFWSVFIPGLAAVSGTWSAMALNVVDFTRYGSSQRSQMVGTVLGTVLPFTATAFVGIAVTGAGYLITGAVLWDPSEWISSVARRVPAVRCVGGLVLGLTVLGINLTANVISPANDFANLAPTKMGFKAGGVITCALGTLLMPWKLLADAKDFVFAWLLGYSSIMGAILGIMLSDYHLLRKRVVDLDGLYDTGAGSPYYYQKGVNLVAVGVTLCVVAPTVPGFLVRVHAVQAESLPNGLITLYDYAFFYAVAASAALYFAATRALQRWRKGSW
eukprot:TRINITY_DN1763_c0_g1_i1.p1 TRINITY_DN1763_c0_g1~~TRINITY_DN1763_c0_g1_i1.p1  ORF type:complete len:427 (-),score=74.99 TRINITY_DN1763_c0_g1_i1:578-1858(-)